MLLSNQQKYILEILKEFKYLRVRQLHALVQAHYRTQGIKIDERRMEIMLRQMRTGTNAGAYKGAARILLERRTA